MYVCQRTVEEVQVETGLHETSQDRDWVDHLFREISTKAVRTDVA